MSEKCSGNVRFFNDSIIVKEFNSPYACGSREFDNSRKYNKEDLTEFEKDYRNLKRAQNNIRDIINANITPYTKFLTLTCKENVLDYKQIKRMFTTFLQAMKREGFNLRYLGVLEHQKGRGLKNNDDGAYHIHLVVFNNEKIPYEIINKHWNGITQIKILNGLRLKDNEKINSVAWYVCKYITKDNLKEYNRHCYFCSKGLYRPLQVQIPYCDYDSEDEDIQKSEEFNNNLQDILKQYKLISKSSYEFNIDLKDSVINQKIQTKKYEVLRNVT